MNRDLDEALQAIIKEEDPVKIRMLQESYNTLSQKHRTVTNLLNNQGNRDYRSIVTEFIKGALHG